MFLLITFTTILRYFFSTFKTLINRDFPYVILFVVNLYWNIVFKKDLSGLTSVSFFFLLFTKSTYVQSTEKSPLFCVHHFKHPRLWEWNLCLPHGPLDFSSREVYFIGRTWHKEILINTNYNWRLYDKMAQHRELSPYGSLFRSFDKIYFIFRMYGIWLNPRVALRCIQFIRD